MATKPKTKIIRERTVEVELVADLTGTNAESLLAQFEQAKADKAAAEARQKEAEVQLRDLLGPAAVGAYEGRKIFRLSPRSNSHFDRELMATTYPEAFAATLRHTPYTVIVAM